MDSMQSILLKEFTSESERSFSLGDTFDMKANVLLVVITFLAGQTAYFLSIAHSSAVRHGQMLSAFLLIVCGALTLIELFPRTYLFFSPSNGAIERKAEKLRAGRQVDEAVISQELLGHAVEWARERAIHNKAINKVKSAILTVVFWVMSGAVAINLITLILFATCPSLVAH